MKDIKLISILKTFSKKEFKDFEKFIDSPFFSTGRNLKPLYLALKKFYPSFGSPEFSLENIFRLLYRDKPYNTALMRKLFSDMAKVTEEYIIIISLRKDPYRQRILKINEFIERDLPALAEKNFTEAENHINNNSIKETVEVDYRFNELCEIKIGYYIDKGMPNAIEGIVRENCSALVNTFYRSFVINLQCLNTTIFSFKKTGLGKTINNFIDNFNFERFAAKSNDPKIKIYYLFFIEANKSQTKETVLELKRLLGRSKNLFSEFERYNLYVGLSSMCTSLNVREFNRTEYCKLQHEIHTDIMKNHLMLNPKNGVMELVRYRNILHIAIINSKIAWAEQFVNDYAGFLPKEFITNVRNLSYGLIEYEKGNYEKSLEYISNINQSQFIFINDVKYLQLKCYYDLDYTDNAYSMINSYRHFINYDDSTPEIRKAHVAKFLKEYQTLTKLKWEFNKEVYDKFEMSLRDSKDSWVYKKLKELKHN